ncbi:MAG TPA: hypothetical protein VK601_11690, partial [Kofleriaceae bacterium]|nr:hypothetical protein [Kofleriaceae bacterium]
MRLLALTAALAGSGGSYMRHPTSTTAWGQPQNALVLGLEARGEVVNAFVQNRGARPQRIIARGITLELRRAGDDAGAAPAKVVRDATGPTRLDREETFETLAPGDYLATPLPIEKLAPGTYQVTASYSALTA